MPVTLRLKLFVLVAGVTLFATTGITAVAVWREIVRGQDLLSREGAAVAATVAGAAARWIGPDGAVQGATEALDDPLARLLEAAPLQGAWIVDRSGRVVACADRTGKGCHPEVPTEFHPATGLLGALVNLVYPEPLEARAPIIREGRLVGQVSVAFWPHEVVGAARSLAWGAATVAILFVALGHLLSVVLVQRFTRPLTDLVAATEALAEGEAIRIETRADPEIDELVSAFNQMSAHLRARREENERLIASLNERVAEATKEVLRADRLATLGGIAAGLAHELGNSLHVIDGYAQVVRRELPADHPNRPDVEAVRRETQRASALLTRFLFFARARTARTEPQAVEPILREAVEVIGPAAAQAKVTTDLVVEADLPPVRADAELLRQAFLNLCVNAVQAMSAGGELKVRAARDGGGIVVRFSDTGPGIPAEVRERIFEPFFTTKPNGTGLGLAIVRQALEAHGGSVEVEDEPRGGASFKVRLPAAGGAA